MEFGDAWQNLALIAVVIILLIASIFFRKRKGESAPMVIAMSLLRDVDKNQKLMEAFLFHWKTKKFKTETWENNEEKLDFLDEELQIALSDAFEMAEEFNEQIEAARKHKTSSYLAAIQVDRLKEPLAESRQGLEEWIQESWGKPELYPKRRGLFG